MSSYRAAVSFLQNVIFYCDRLVCPKGIRSYGVMVSTSDFDSGDPSSSIGRTFLIFFHYGFTYGLKYEFILKLAFT